MAIVKHIEVSSESSTSFDDAAAAAVREVSKTVKNVRQVWVKDFEIRVGDDGAMTYRTNCKVSFVVKDAGDMV